MLLLAAPMTPTEAAEWWLAVALCVAIIITIGAIYLSRWTIALTAFTVTMVCAVGLIILLSGPA